MVALPSGTTSGTTTATTPSFYGNGGQDLRDEGQVHEINVDQNDTEPVKKFQNNLPTSDILNTPPETDQIQQLELNPTQAGQSQQNQPFPGLVMTINPNLNNSTNSNNSITQEQLKSFKSEPSENSRAHLKVIDPADSPQIMSESARLGGSIYRPEPIIGQVKDPCGPERPQGFDSHNLRRPGASYSNAHQQNNTTTGHGYRGAGDNSNMNPNALNGEIMQDSTEDTHTTTDKDEETSSNQTPPGPGIESQMQVNCNTRQSADQENNLQPDSSPESTPNYLKTENNFSFPDHSGITILMINKAGRPLVTVGDNTLSTDDKRILSVQIMKIIDTFKSAMEKVELPRYSPSHGHGSNHGSNHGHNHSHNSNQGQGPQIISKTQSTTISTILKFQTSTLILESFTISDTDPKNHDSLMTSSQINNQYKPRGTIRSNPNPRIYYNPIDNKPRELFMAVVVRNDVYEVGMAKRICLRAVEIASGIKGRY